MAAASPRRSPPPRPRVALIVSTVLTLTIPVVAQPRTDVSAPPPPALAQLVAGDAHLCARTTDGAVYCWGSNSHGQLGVRSSLDRSRPLRVPGLEGVVQLSAGGTSTCALLRDGTVRCWGAIRSPGPPGAQETRTPAEVRGIAGATQVVNHTEHGCALLADTTVRCWGRNDAGQVGDGTIIPRSEAVAVQDLRGVRQLAATAAGTCALLDRGTVACWGSLPEGRESHRAITRSGLARVRSIAAAPGYVCALEESGEVLCWGDPDVSHFAVTRQVQIANAEEGDTRMRLVSRPVRVVPPGSGVARMDVGSWHFCVFTAQGNARCGGRHVALPLAARSYRRGLPPMLPMPELDGAHDVAMIDTQQFGYETPPVPDPWGLTSSGIACALGGDGVARCWGTTAGPQLGIGVPPETDVPYRVPGVSGAVEVGSNLEVGCARLRSGEVTCWGEDSHGGLGDGNGTSSPPRVRGLSDATQLAFGSSHACALRQDHTVVCWGENLDGQLGDGSRTFRAAPVTVAGITDAVQIGAASRTTCARRADGTVYCWGLGWFGHLGVDHVDSRPTPAPVPGLANAEFLAVGGERICARVRGGDVVCWGGTQTFSPPAPDASLRGSAPMSGGAGAIYARFPDGVLHAAAPHPWLHDLLPETLGADTTEIAAGQGFACLRRRTSVLCAGDFGQPPDGASRSGFSPVPNLPPVTQLRASLNRACAIDQDGAVWCWGGGVYEPRAPVATPTPIVWR